MRNQITGTRMMQLSEQEWWLVAASLGPMQLWGVENPWQGLEADQVSQARQEAIDSLTSAGWLQSGAGGLRFHPWLIELADVCRTAKAVLTVQSVRGRIRQQVYLNGEQALLQYPLAPGVVELTLIPDRASLMVLFADDLLLDSGKIGRLPEFTLPADALLESAQLFRIAEGEKAAQRLAEVELPGDVMERLQAALDDPVGNMSVTLIPYVKEGEQAVPQGFGLLEGEEDLWVLHHQGKQVVVQPVSPGVIRRMFVDLMEGWFKKE